MKFKYNIVIVISCLVLGFTSCSIDEIKPINQLVEETVITNKKSARNFLNGIYNKHRGSMPKIATVTDAAGVEQVMSRQIWGATGFDVNAPLNDGRALTDIYSQYYVIINATNFFIELIEASNAGDLTPQVKKEMISEAKFFRAQAHFNLLRMFGQFYDKTSALGIVTSITPYRGKIEKARSSVQETYDIILADLQYAADNGPSGVNHYLVSATTAKALLAKVQLYAGDYTNAAINALAAINNTDGYALATSYGAVFADRWGTETLFAPFINGGTESSFYDMANYIRNSAPSAIFKNIADASTGAVDGTRDARYVFAYDTAPGVNGNGKYQYGSYSPTDNGGNTFFFLRLSEVYLIYAEAEARRPGGVLADALAKVNKIRNRADAGLPAKVLSDKATLLADIRNEKMLELFRETGESYYDLVRYDRLGDVSASAIKATMTADKLIFPIPLAALAGNSLLVPNP